MKTEVFILTFNRPEALNRLILQFGEQGWKVNIFSNHPVVKLIPEYRKYIDRIVVNTLNSEESNSWCARSWNTIFMKAFDNPEVENLICIQDDTAISGDFVAWMLNAINQNMKFIWGPAGDQFFMINRSIFQKTGWWDERYIGCYCGDADYLKRVYFTYQSDSSNIAGRVSIQDSHNWGFSYNPMNISRYVITTFQSKTIGTYENQHWQFERVHGCADNTNPTILASQKHFREKWDVDLDNGRPVISSYNRQIDEIDWYPWFSKKHNIQQG